MRVFISCQSPLLQKTLDNLLSFLKTDDKDICDFIVSDKKTLELKPTFLISNKKDANISLPFLKDELILELEEFFKDLTSKEIKSDLANAIKQIKKEQNKKIKKLAKKIS